MKVTSEKLPESRMVLNIEVDGEEVESTLEQTYQRLVQRVKIPGFRPGKAPRALLQSYLGKDALLDEALETLVPTVVKRAIEEQKIQPVDDPEVEVVERDPVVLKATVPLQPTVDLGDYKSIRLEQEKVEVTPERVENVVEELRYRQAPWQPADRPVAFGDLLTIDVEGKVDGSTVISEKGVPYSPSRDSTNPISGFSQQLENMTAQKTKEFTLALPEDYPGENLGGRECQFRVTVHEIKEKNLPPLDDDFARSLGEEYKNLEMLREEVASNLLAHAQEEAQRQFEDRLVEILKDGAHIEAPPVLQEREIDHLVMDEARALAARGVKFDNYLKTIDKTAEQLREDFREVAAKRVATSLLLGKLAELEGIQVEEREVQEEIDSMIESAGDRAEEVRELFQKEGPRSSLEQTITRRKALSALKEIALSKEAPKSASASIVSHADEKSEVKE
ncbi:MAG: trigger factor [Dehalococcoidia bacterium]